MLHLAMALGLAAGLLFGLVASFTGSPLLLAVAEGVSPLGTLFINAVRMVVIPLVAVTIFNGVVQLGSPRKMGRMGGTAVAFFWITTVPAILIGMGLMAAALPFAPEFAAPPAAAGASEEIPGLVDFLVGLVPANPVAAAAEGELLQVIVFTALFSAAACAVDDEHRLRLLRVTESLGEALLILVTWVLWTAPLGIFALAAPVTASSGMALLGSLAVFVGTVIVGLALFVTVVYLPAVRFLGGISLRTFVRAAYPGAVVGFGTTSSVATLPVLLESAPDAKVSGPVASLVLSLGAAINRSGSALFQGAALVFLAHAYEVSLGTAALVGAVIAVFLAALSVAPVPSASIVTLAPALEAVGVPLAGLGVLLGIDRIPDMFRASVNMIGHMAGAVVVEGRVGSGEAASAGTPGTPGTESAGGTSGRSGGGARVRDR